MKNKEFNQFSWDNITGDKYYKIKDIFEEEGLDDIERQVKLVSVITDTPEEDIYNLSIDESWELFNKLSFLGEFKLIENFNPKYIQLPSYKLSVCKDTAKLTVSQFIDYQSFTKYDIRKTYDKILSIFLIPEGCSYNIDYNIADVQKEIRENLSWREVQSLLGFFITVYLRSLTASLKSFDRIIQKTKDPKTKEKMQIQRDQLVQKIKDLCIIGSSSSNA